jgi:hypothetical protein
MVQHLRYSKVQSDERWMDNLQTSDLAIARYVLAQLDGSRRLAIWVCFTCNLIAEIALCMILRMDFNLSFGSIQGLAPLVPVIGILVTTLFINQVFEIEIRQLNVKHRALMTAIYDMAIKRSDDNFYQLEWQLEGDLSFSSKASHFGVRAIPMLWVIQFGTAAIGIFAAVR